MELKQDQAVRLSVFVPSGPGDNIPFPDGTTVKWTVDGDAISLEVDGDNGHALVTPLKSGNAIVTAVITLPDGEVYEGDTLVSVLNPAFNRAIVASGKDLIPLTAPKNDTELAVDEPAETNTNQAE